MFSRYNTVNQYSNAAGLFPLLFSEFHARQSGKIDYQLHYIDEKELLAILSSEPRRNHKKIMKFDRLYNRCDVNKGTVQDRVFSGTVI